jgi:hypothetical protein
MLPNILTSQVISSGHLFYIRHGRRLSEIEEWSVTSSMKIGQPIDIMPQ